MEKRPTQSRERGQGGNSPLRGQGAELPCGVWGNAPTVPRATNSKEKVNQGAGSEASLPVTSRSRRSAPKLLFRPTMLCRARWARPRSLTSDHSCSFPNAGDFASAEATKGLSDRPLETFGAATFGVVCGLNLLLQGISPLRARQGGFAVAPLTPSQRTLPYLIFIASFLVCVLNHQ